MEHPLNCTELCRSMDCTTNPEMKDEDNWHVLQQLCKLLNETTSEDANVSPVLYGVMCTLLSSGIALSVLFMIFTIKFKRNRIVKMSSPNLNVATLFGSTFTYISGYLFGIEKQIAAPGTSLEIIFQMRIWILCIGTSLVFGPILGKSWRLYRVFTQRVPDKRVIIKDIQLLGLVAGLICADILILTTWRFADPIYCIKTLSAALKVAEKNITYSVMNTGFCASAYSDLWMILILILKGSLLLYGTYLAGLTSNVSSPPVNQSLTIMVGVCLITSTTLVTVPVARSFSLWPNLVYVLISGGIFTCTTTINCLIFIPQLRQWKQFQSEETQSVSQMAKYLHSPSKSFMYSDEQIFYLLGENNTMKQLLSEKNAVIEGLQEQVSNAKEKLMRLMSSEFIYEHKDSVSSSDCNTPFNCSNKIKSKSEDQGKEILDNQANGISTRGSLEQTSHSLNCHVATSNLGHDPEHSLELQNASSHTLSQNTQRDSTGDQEQSCSADSGFEQTGSMITADHSDIHCKELTYHAENYSTFTTKVVGSHGEPESKYQKVAANLVTAREVAPKVNKHSYVSSEKLQEILQELSIDNACSIRSSRSKQIANPVQHELTDHRHRFQHSSPGMIKNRKPHVCPVLYSQSQCYFQNAKFMNKDVRRRNLNGLRTLQSTVDPVPIHTTTYSAAAVVNDDRGSSPSSSLVKKSDAEMKGRKSSSAGEPQVENWSNNVGFNEVSDYCDQAKVYNRRPHSSHQVTIPKFGQQETEGLTRPEKSYPYDYSDSESTSSDESGCCCCQNPYCEDCVQRPYISSESCTSETSDSEHHDRAFHWPTDYITSQPVVNFKDDLRPTFV
ncbi:probable G-protein coupled receptor 156 [Protopterus annectens]|uniref:probable G-protein coupled receptor 156 n=1 Tax=Protopterus annectens TaxID=7888 RepID=UPI001CFC1C91|nr:probable G-protein coupled receptor 156 [Protopterus annectens]